MMADDVEFEWHDGQLTMSGSPDSFDRTPTPGGRPISRRTIGGCLLIAVLLLGAGWAVNAYRGRTVHPTVRAIELPGVGAGVDAAGCPYGSTSCQTNGGLSSNVQRFTDTFFPGSVQLLSRGASDQGSHVRSVTLRTRDRIVITATSQCFPGTDPVPNHTDLFPSDRPTDALIVISGAPGCSVAVSAHAPTGVVLPIPTLQALAGAAAS